MERQVGPSPVASHMAHSTVSAVTPGAQRSAPSSSTVRAASTPAAIARATRLAGAASGPTLARKSGLTMPAASSSSLVRPPPASSSSRRSARRNRRRPTVSAPPIGESTASTAVSGSIGDGSPSADRSTTSSSDSRGRTAISSRTGTSLLRHRHRHPGRHQDAPQRAGPPLAAHDHRHLRPRHPVEQVGLAQLGGDQRRLLGRGPQQPHVDPATGPDGDRLTVPPPHRPPRSGGSPGG